MKEDYAKEKLRIIDTLKENVGMIISVGGFMWLIFQFVIIPMNQMSFQIENILDNHLATIQTELTEAKTERDFQGKQLTNLSEQIIRLQTIMETKQ
jgi:hypothetical protein